MSQGESKIEQQRREWVELEQRMKDVEQEYESHLAAANSQERSGLAERLRSRGRSTRLS